MLAPPLPARRTTPARVVVGALIAAGAGAVLGGLTSFAQGMLPDAVSSLANSASGWTLLTVLVVAALRMRPVPSALAAMLCFVALVLGYQTVSDLRGFPTSEVFWLVAGIVAGPFVGVATAWLRERGPRAALGAGLLAGIGLGEGVFGLTVIGDTTSPVYWTAVLVIAVALLVAVEVRSLATLGQRFLAPAVAVAIGAALIGSYLVL